MDRERSKGMERRGEREGRRRMEKEGRGWRGEAR